MAFSYFSIAIFYDNKNIRGITVINALPRILRECVTSEILSISVLKLVYSSVFDYVFFFGNSMASNP